MEKSKDTLSVLIENFGFNEKQLQQVLESNIHKVEIILQKKKCNIHIKSKAKWDLEVLKKIKEGFSNYFSNAFDIDLVVTSKTDITLENIKEIWPKVIKEASRLMPSVQGWLNFANFKLVNKSLYVYIHNSSGVELLESKGCKKTLEKILYMETGEKFSVLFEEEDLSGVSEEIYVKQKNLEEHIIQNSIKIKDASKLIDDSQILLGRKINDKPIKISSLTNEDEAVISGEIFDLQLKKLRNKQNLILFSITDYTSSIYVKVFAEEELFNKLKKIDFKQYCLKLRGKISYDEYMKDTVITAKDVVLEERQTRTDSCEEKRVELHLHTQLSAMDGIGSIKEYIKRAYEWGHKAIAITDHGVVQGFPEAYSAAKKYGIKVILGIEAYMVDDKPNIITNSNKSKIEESNFVVFDIETTGLSPLKDEIIEIGAVKINRGQVIDTFNEFVKPNHSIPYHITKLTGITNETVKDANKIDKILPRFIDFVKDSVLVAHNAQFDLGFILAECTKMNIDLNNPVIDTLNLSRALYPELKNHKLKTIAEKLGVKIINHHRAVDDARATSEIFIKLLKILKKQNVICLNDINSLNKYINLNNLKPYHITILVKNSTGLKNLYKLVSKSHIKYFHKNPRIPKSLLNEYREGLLLGSACESGEVYQAILRNASLNEIIETIKFYDYLEIQPLANNQFLINKGYVKDQNQLKDINIRIYELGKTIGKPTVATGDVHFLDPCHKDFRKILLHGQGFDDAENQPPLYLRTTNEMLKEFSYLGESACKEVVVENTNTLAEKIEDVKPIPDKLFSPKIEGAEKTIIQMTFKKARELYGDKLNSIVKKRIKKELKSIITNNFAVIYLIAHKIVKKSLDDGYLVGSRGSVGSSLVATLCGITEVNPLPPHYLCPNCKLSIFDVPKEFEVGPDLPDKNCPDCGSKLRKDGYNIPFEVFLGFEGDKVPDIDLNFSGEYQPLAHKFTEKLFGKEHVFRAGTIGTIAEKTAYGFVKGYMEDKNINLHKAEIERLVKGCSGVKRTTGQHPGGLMIVPKDKEIYDFTPIQYPADDKNSGVITTHFDYHAISSRLLKLDILGHDDPTVLRMLQDITGVNPTEIPLDDSKTMEIFCNEENTLSDKNDTKIGSLGIPEFGTRFVRQMLKDTNPTTFSELIRISGLSHGTDVWLNNAKDLIHSGIATLKEVISTRDDIMTYLIDKDMNSRLAFMIMEKVRKGKGLSLEDEQNMRAKNVPDWFINSCKKIKYMFPKAHAVAYVIMAFRIAYFKVHYPEAFYATYFTVRADDFDADLILRGEKSIKKKIEEIELKRSQATQKEKNLLTILEVALEMMSRGFCFRPVDLYFSDSKKFIITNDGLLPPFNALQGVGITAAQNIVNSREKGPFISIEDLRKRAKLSKTVIETLRKHGCLDKLPETNQLNLFSLA